MRPDYTVANVRALARRRMKVHLTNECQSNSCDLESGTLYSIVTSLLGLPPASRLDGWALEAGGQPLTVT